METVEYIFRPKKETASCVDSGVGTGGFQHTHTCPPPPSAMANWTLCILVEECLRHFIGCTLGGTHPVDVKGGCFRSFHAQG